MSKGPQSPESQPKKKFTLLRWGILVLICIAFIAPEDIQVLRTMMSQSSEKGIRQASVKVGIDLLFVILGLGLVVVHFVHRKRF